MFRTFTKTKHTNQNTSSCQSQYQDTLQQLNSKCFRIVIAHHPGTAQRFEASSRNDTNGSVERLGNTSSATSRRLVFIPTLYSP
jgi:ABC-type bacteriocin/lantibiotic exporter with double-glycine peptidase domain